MTSNGMDERPTRYVMVVDRGAGTRPTGVLTAAVYGEPGEEDTMVVVFDMAEADATLTGKQVGRNIADFMCEHMDPGIPVSVMIGTTVGGTKPVKWVILPAARRRLKAIQEWAQSEGRDDIAQRAQEGFTHDLYCANVAGAPRDVGRKITVHQRVGELTTALELGRLRILGDLPLYEDVTNALRSFDPGKRSKEGKDLWDAGAHEGLLTALTVLPKAVGYARVFHARANHQGRVRVVDVMSPDSGYGMASGSYVGRDGVFGIDGTAGWDGFAARPDHLVNPGLSDMSSGGRLKALGRALTAWREGSGPVAAEGPDESNRLRLAVERTQAYVSGGYRHVSRAPSYEAPYPPMAGSEGGGGWGPVARGLNEATAGYEARMRGRGW